jgi:hypothetical protein
MTQIVRNNQSPNTQLVKSAPLKSADIDEIDRSVADLGARDALLPLRPFTITGLLKSCRFEEYGAGGASRSKGMKFVILVESAEEPAFKNAAGDVVPPVIESGREWPCIYFTEHTAMHEQALKGHALFRRRLLAACVGANWEDDSFLPSVVLKKLNSEVVELDIPIKMTRTFVRFTANKKPVFDDQFEAVE